jgi:hypothetical protein
MLILRTILLVAVGTVYAGLVLMSYVVFGPGYRLNLDPETPLVSLGRLLVWVGVKAFYLAVRSLRAILNLLSDTSAEVGDWLVRRTSEEVQAAYRSRVL